jgi:hypothetical protein
MAVDQDVIGSDQEGMEDAPLPDRVTKLGELVGRQSGQDVGLVGAGWPIRLPTKRDRPEIPVPEVPLIRLFDWK